MITIKVGHNQDPTRAFQKLKNKLIQEELFIELKKRRYYAKPSKKKKLKLLMGKNMKTLQTF